MWLSVTLKCCIADLLWLLHSKAGYTSLLFGRNWESLSMSSGRSHEQIVGWSTLKGCPSSGGSGGPSTWHGCHWGQLPSTVDLVQCGVTVCLANPDLIWMTFRCHLNGNSFMPLRDWRYQNALGVTKLSRKGGCVSEGQVKVEKEGDIFSFSCQQQGYGSPAPWETLVDICNSMHFHL